MASAIEVFEAAVFETVFETLSERDGDAACDIIAAGLAEIVDGLIHADAVEFIAAQAPRVVPAPDASAEGADESLILNDFWYREDTFSPIFYALAREFYALVRPQTYPPAPGAILDEDETALFGCRLADVQFEGANPASGATLLWAGCTVAAVRLCLQKSLAIPLGYTLLFRYAREFAEK